MIDPLLVRRAARVILLDPENRVLLMRYDDGPPNGSHWSTPGGGLNTGEEYPAAALRELAEETGWHDVVLLGEALRREFEMQYGQRWSATSLPARPPAARSAASHMSLAELDSTTQAVWPPGLADVIRNALSRG